VDDAIGVLYDFDSTLRLVISHTSPA